MTLKETKIDMWLAPKLQTTQTQRLFFQKNIKGILP